MRARFLMIFSYILRHTNRYGESIGWRLPPLQSTGDNHVAKVYNSNGDWHLTHAIFSMGVILLYHPISRHPRYREILWTGMFNNYIIFSGKVAASIAFKLEACVHPTPDHLGQPRGKKFPAPVVVYT